MVRWMYIIKFYEQINGMKYHFFLKQLASLLQITFWTFSAYLI